MSIYKEGLNKNVKDSQKYIKDNDKKSLSR